MNQTSATFASEFIVYPPIELGTRLPTEIEIPGQWERLQHFKLTYTTIYSAYFPGDRKHRNKPQNNNDVIASTLIHIITIPTQVNVPVACSMIFYGTIVLPIIIIINYAFHSN